VTKASVTILEGRSQADAMRKHLYVLADFLEKGYGISEENRCEIASWLRATAEGRDLRRLLGLLGRPEINRPYWIGFDYLVRYKITGVSKVAAADVASDWGVKSKAVFENYAAQRAQLDDELAYQLTIAKNDNENDQLKAWEIAIKCKRLSLPGRKPKKSAQKKRPKKRASKRRQA